MLTSALLAGFLSFSLFPSASLKAVDPSFQLAQLKGKKVACADSAAILSGGFDLDGMYARGVFDSTYVPAATYTTPLSESLCDIVAEREGAVRVRDSLAGPADYVIVLESIRIHHRVSIETKAAVRRASDGSTLARIVVDAEDKFGMGGKKRFQKGFETLRGKIGSNLRKDYPRKDDASGDE